MSLFLSVCPSVCLSIHPSVHLLRSMSQELSGHNFWYTYAKWWYHQGFFSFFQNFDFLAVRGVKRAKNSPKWEITITSVTHHISGTVHHLIIIFGTHFKMMISPGLFFFIFSKFWFFRVLGELKGKNSPKWEITIASVTDHISGTIHHLSDHNFWYTYAKWWYLQGFFSLFQNFDFLCC